MKVEFKDNSKEFLAEFLRKKALSLIAIGEAAEGHAKDECPVDTGRLRNSISHAEDDDTAYIGTNVEYAPAVEFRDIAHKTGKAHFLRDAATTHGDEYKNIVETILKS